jgi:hypothetical protein
MTQGVKEIKAWKTSDGCIFTDYQLAQKRQEEINIDEWYKNDMLSVETDDEVYEIKSDKVLGWLRRNRVEILKLLEAPTAAQLSNLESAIEHLWNVIDMGNTSLYKYYDGSARRAVDSALTEVLGRKSESR